MTFLATIWTVAVFCGPIGAHAEGEYIPGRGVVLSNSNCQVLKQPTRFPLYMNAWAVFIVAHEEGHAHDPLASSQQQCGVVGPCELSADCYGAGHMRRIARALGYKRAEAQRFYVWAHAHRWTLSPYGPIAQRCWT